MLNQNLGAEILSSEEIAVDRSLRPRRLADYVGQASLKEKLQIFIEAARRRGEALDHCLFSGPPGLGKTTLANIVSQEMGVHLRSTSGPAIERPGDLAAILTNLEPNDVLFIDEIHRLPITVEEILYPAMEDFQLDIVLGQGPSAKTIKLDLPRFTLVGATTRTGLLTSPLRDRFGFAARLEFYSQEELADIVKRAAKILEIPITEAGAVELAKRARGTPRIVNRLLRRARDYAEVRAAGLLDAKVAAAALTLLDVDEHGLDRMDHQLLLTIIEKFQGGPVGVETLSSALNEEKDTLEDVYEPYLIQCGFLQRTSRGRVATDLAYQYFGKTPLSSIHPQQQKNLFLDKKNE